MLKNCSVCKKELGDEFCCKSCFPNDYFWNKYISSDEIEQIKMLESLPLKVENGFIKFMTITLFKSYIDDVIKVRIE